MYNNMNVREYGPWIIFWSEFLMPETITYNVVALLKAEVSL